MLTKDDVNALHELVRGANVTHSLILGRILGLVSDREVADYEGPVRRKVHAGLVSDGLGRTWWVGDHDNPRMCHS
jgi:hypothetical protein